MLQISDFFIVENEECGCTMIVCPLPVHALYINED